MGGKDGSAVRLGQECAGGRRGLSLLSFPAPGEKPRDEKGKHGAGAPMRRQSRQRVDGQAGTHSTASPPGPRSGAVRQDPGRAPVTRRPILIHECGLFFPKS